MLVKLEDVILSLNTGLNPRMFFKLNTEDATNYYVTIREIRGGKLIFTERTDRINDEALKLCNNRSNLEVGDVLFSGTGTIGETLVVEDEPKNWNIKEGVYTIKPNPSKLNPYYLKYLLTSDTIRAKIMRKVAGGTVKSIPMAELRKIEIPLPPLDVQRRIADTLDKVTELIDLRKKQLEKLDELVKARFVELFGTLDYPVQEFKKATLKELCTKITDGKHGGCTQEEGTERYFVGAREIYDNAVHYDTAPEINLAEFEKDYKRCNVEIGDFLIVNTGATIGKSAIAIDPRTEYTLLQKSVALLKAKRELLNPVFLQYCYKVNEKMYKVESASAQPNLLLSKINSTKIYVPPIELQNQFAAFVEQTDKSKVIIQQSLDTLETLKKSLMQEYFG